MTLLRIFTVLFAIIFFGVEIWRSSVAGRDVTSLIDDGVFAALLIIGAIIVARGTVTPRAFFAATWAVNTGHLYPSILVLFPSTAAASAVAAPPQIMVILTAIGFGSAVIATLAAIFLPAKHTA